MVRRDCSGQVILDTETRVSGRQRGGTGRPAMANDDRSPPVVAAGQHELFDAGLDGGAVMTGLVLHPPARAAGGHPEASGTG